MSRPKKGGRTTGKLPSIVLDGDPVLRSKAEPVTVFGPELKALASTMRKKMIAAKGVGLAANQIGRSENLFVYNVHGEHGVVINPEIVFASLLTHLIPEGCLSVPKAGHKSLERPLAVALKGQDLTGKTIYLYGEKLLARCFLHETGHLQGELFTDLL